MPYRRKGSPFWWISYTAPGGERVRESSGATRREEAKALEAGKRLETHRVKRWGETPLYTWDQVLLRYLKATPGKKSHDRDLLSAKHLRKFFTGIPVASTTPELIAAYKDSRKVKPATIGRELTMASAAIRHAQKELGWQIPNPVSGRIPQPRRGTPRWLRKDEALALLEAARRQKRAPHLADFIELALATGMRRDEMLRLEWARVDLAQRLVYLRPEDQKAGRVGSVALNDTAAAVLERLPKRGPWVFAHEGGERIQSVRKAFTAAAKAAGLSGITPHTLRHTAAAWLVQAGIPIRTVAEVLRHADIRTSMIYAHLAPEAPREAVRALELSVTGL